MKKKIEDKENVIVFLFNKFYPFWPLFACLVVGSILISWVYIHFKAPVYEITATLIIKDEKKGVDDSKIMQTMNPFDQKKIVENEIEVIKSRDLMKGVVDKYHLYAPILKKKGFGFVSAYRNSPITVALKQPENIQISTEKPEEIGFTFNSLENKVLLSNKEYPVDKWEESPLGTIKFELNGSYKEQETKNSEFYFVLFNPKVVTDNLLKNLEVSAPDKLSTIVNISVNDEIPKRGEDIVNGLIEFYNNKILANSNKMAASSVRFIDQRINQVEDDLNQLESQIQKYKSNKGAIDLSEQGKLYLRDVGENDRQIADIKFQLEVLENIQNYVVSKGISGGIVPSTQGIDSAILSQLLEKLYDSEIEYKKLKNTTAENNPILSSLQNEIDNIRPSILENVLNQRANLESRLKNLSTTNKQYSASLSRIPEQERSLLEISRKKSIKNDLFSFLLQKREEVALAFSPSDGDSRVVNFAESSIQPVSPKPKLTYFIGIVLAVIFGASYVAGKEMLNRKVLFRSEIEEATNIPILGEISQFNGKENSLFVPSKDFLIKEQFGQLNARLGLYNHTIEKKIILVTSSVAGEGKSYVSSNLAFSLAKIGRKVVLVDFDLRRPHTTSLFQHTQSPGAVGLLKGKNSYQEVIYPYEKLDKLSIVPAGTTGGDFTHLVLNGKLKGFLKRLSENFDHVIIDSSPLKVVSEGHVLIQCCDTALLVVRHDFTPKELIKHLDANLNSSFEAGIVFNGLKNRGFSKNKYGLNYGFETPYFDKAY